MSEESPEVLYHYCSLDTFYNIMKNRSIWLSDISKSNDSEELIFMTKKSREKINQYFKPSNPNSEIAAQINRTEHALQQFAQNDYLKCWAMCFSEKPDNLGQWRGYADDGRGLCIGFNGEEIQNIAESAAPLEGITDVFLKKVRYGEQECEQYIDRMLSLIVKCDLSDRNSAYQQIKEAILSIIRMAPLYKEETFREEEWRLGILALTEKSLTPSFSLQHLPRKMADKAVTMDKYSFVPKNNTLVSHIELKFADLKTALHSIIIGPKSGLSELDIKLFLVSLGILESTKDDAIKISHSSASYR